MYIARIPNRSSPPAYLRRESYREGGYEVRNSLSSTVSYGRPETVEPATEDRIVDAVHAVLPRSFLPRK